jgi:tousled-like kinase
MSSNSRSNPGKASKKKLVEDKSIRKIDHFFSAVKKSIADSQKSGNALHPPESHPTESAELDFLRNRCQELEQKCKDMDSQLKAVSNNQTIMHTALKASLSQRDKELEELRESNEKDAAKTSTVVEKLVRLDSGRAAKELRQKLASDGARLGRITYTRAGLRTVETWEEGHALKLLLRRKSDLQVKKQVLLERQDKAEQATTALSQGQKITISIDGLVLSDALTIVEAQESVRLHLSELAKDENLLKEEEQSLKNDKTEHIRALKRVASEDASPFRSRPKVCFNIHLHLQHLFCIRSMDFLLTYLLLQLNDQYVLLSLLGKGGFSEVWRAFDLSMLREVAVKIHQLDPRWSEAKKDNYTKHVSREYEIHRDVRHPRIVSLFDVFEIDNNSFATVLECCKGTDLDSLLKERRCLPERDARAILLQLLSGMNYLSHPSGSRQGIIHYDLKPGNILFDEFGDAKITDFGLSKIVDAPDAAESMELTSQGAGTYWYLPPECFVTSHSVRISNKVDVWSIGVIYYQMLFGKRPFGDGMSQDRVLTDNTMLNAREVRFPDSPHTSPEAKEFIQQCLMYDQTFRPTVGQICKSSYLLQKTL